MLPSSIANLLSECEKKKRGQCVHMHMYAWREKYEEKKKYKTEKYKKGKED